jgi:hypothetical protein
MVRTKGFYDIRKRDQELLTLAVLFNTVLALSIEGLLQSR